MIIVTLVLLYCRVFSKNAKLPFGLSADSLHWHLQCSTSPRNFFTARVYAKLLHNDPYGRISNMQFFNYVMRKGAELWIRAQLHTGLIVSTETLWCVFGSSSVAASDPHWPEFVWCGRTGLPQGVGQCRSSSPPLSRAWTQTAGLTLVTKLQDLENYILELIPTLPQLDGLEKSFYSFYVCTAVRKFFFFLDPLRTGESEPQTQI